VTASPRSSRTSPRPQVVVVGSGFAGFFAARKLARADDVDVTVLSATDGMLYQPLLPDVAVGTVDPRSVVVPLTSTLRGAARRCCARTPPVSTSINASCATPVRTAGPVR